MSDQQTDARERVPADAPAVRFFFPGPAKAAYYRLVQPFRYLKARGYDVKIYGTLDRPYLDDGDVFVFGKVPGPAVLEAAEHIHARGKKLIFDLDEMLLCPPPHHPAFRTFYGDTPSSRLLRKVLEAADLVTVPTARLGEAASEYAKKTLEVPFLVDLESLPRTKERVRAELGVSDDAVLIGWAGTRAHLEDLLVVKRAAERLMEMFPDVSFVSIGGQSMPLDIPSDRHLHLAAVGLQGYLDGIQVLDVGLAPLTDSLFNRCKSYLKLAEYGAFGVPAVASPIAPYSEAEEAGAPIRMAADSEQWRAALESLISDPQARRVEGVALHAHTELRWSVAAAGRSYADMLDALSAEE